MDLTILLADYSTADQGSQKINALGMGWSVTSTPLPPQAVVVIFEVGWDETNQPHQALLRLVDTDGAPVNQPTPMGEQPVQIQVDFEAGRPAGAAAGTPIVVPMCLNFPAGLPVPPGRYEWRVTVDGDARQGWCRGFTVMPR